MKRHYYYHPYNEGIILKLTTRVYVISDKSMYKCILNFSLKILEYQLQKKDLKVINLRQKRTVQNKIEQ